MAERREIDERDIDRLLAALTDVQIAALFGMTNADVYRMRQARLMRKQEQQDDKDCPPPADGSRTKT